MTRVVLVGEEAWQRLAPIAGALESAGLVLYQVDRPSELGFLLEEGQAEAVVFDPTALGDELFDRLRRRHPSQAWIAWTAGYVSSRTARLLAGGAGEVVNGTMREAEVVARILKAVRPGREDGVGTVSAGGLTVNARTGEADWRGEEIEFTRREREVLAVLARSAGRTVPRETLYREVWGFAMARGDRTVDVNVKRIRAKLAAAGAAIEIKTRAGVGYRLELSAVRADPFVTEL